MFSLPKLLVLVVIILAVLYGFKLVTSVNRRRTRDELQDRPRATKRKRGRLDAEDLVPCPKCGAYVAADGEHDCRRRA